MRAPATSGIVEVSPMHRVMPWLTCALSLALATVALGAQRPADVDGARDHPMISRIEGSRLIGFDEKAFDEYRLVVGPFTGYDGDGIEADPLEQGLTDANSRRIEGRVWKLTYETPGNRSTLEILRSFEKALTTAGFQVLFECAGVACAGKEPRRRLESFAPPRWRENFSTLLMARGGFRVSGDVDEDRRYLAARLTRPAGDVYVSVFALGLTTPVARLDVIEVRPGSDSLVRVTADQMASEIAAAGSAALYGIHFDAGAAVVKPESQPALTEIAALLKRDPKLQLIIVGHTDNDGRLEPNLDLSLRRAEAVAAALVAQFGVSPARLDARGVAFLAPVAPNTTEEGKARNRRVELVPR
jgi:outer membrane protein OmpA-like peptidoglycan-associated protein